MFSGQVFCVLFQPMTSASEARGTLRDLQRMASRAYVCLRVQCA